MRILGLDTSGKVASAAILDTDRRLLLGERSLYTTRGHSQVILPMCRELLTECGMTPADVDCYAVSVGPGSYTGLRIGIAAVQGMAMVRNTPCIGVSTLEAMACNAPGIRNIFCLIHARETLCYGAWFDFTKDLVRRSEDALMTYEEIFAHAETLDGPIMLLGEGVDTLYRAYRDWKLPPSQRFLRHVKGEPVLPEGSADFNCPLRHLQSAAGVCHAAWIYAEQHEVLPTPADLTASYLQAVNITKKKG